MAFCINLKVGKYFFIICRPTRYEFSCINRSVILSFVDLDYLCLLFFVQSQLLMVSR